MIIQHPMFWCAAFLTAGIAAGLYFPSYCYLPLLAACIVFCTLLRRIGPLHDILTLLVWFLIGCSRASVPVDNNGGSVALWTMENKAKAIRTTLVKRLETAGLSPRTLALCSALTMGEKAGLTREMRQSYNQVGASHLLALSGMHLGIIYGILYLILIRSVRYSQWRWFVLPFILFCLWGYTIIAGMPFSLLRAAIMLSVFSIISLMQYDTDPLHPLALSAIIILLITPAALLNISFQLSFSAVLFLLALWTPLEERLPRLHWAVRLLLVSCVASLGTMPLTLYYFHYISLIGPLLSILLIPLTSIIIYLTLAVMVLPTTYIGLALNMTENIQNLIIEHAGNLTFATLSDIYLSKIQVILAYAALMIAIVRLRTRSLTL